MFSRFSRRIACNKQSVRRMSQCNNNNKDIKYDMIISDLTYIKSNLFVLMVFALPASAYNIGTGIGTVLAKIF